MTFEIETIFSTVSVDCSFLFNTTTVERRPRGNKVSVMMRDGATANCFKHCDGFLNRLSQGVAEPREMDRPALPSNFPLWDTVELLSLVDPTSH